MLNAVMDYLFMMAGFFAAYTLRIPTVIAGVLCLELTAGLIGRDSFALSTIQLIAPVDAITDWQQEVNPTPFNGITN